MKKQTIAISAMLASLLITTGTPVLAVEQNTRAVERSAKKELRTEKAVVLKKDNALKEIDRRVESLNKLVSKIKVMKRLSETQVSSLQTQIQNEISALNALRAKIVADTDLATLVTHKKEIVDSYRIYALFVPKMTIIANADKIIELADLMNTKATTEEAKTYIASAKADAELAISKVTPLIPAEYPGNKTVLDEARKLLSSARTSLNKARPIINAKVSEK